MTVYKYNKETGKVEEWTPTAPPESAFQIMPMFKPYRAVGIDGSMVNTRTEHKNLLKQHGCEELGNEKPKHMKERAEARQERGEM